MTIDYDNFLSRLDIVCQGMEAGLTDWPLASQIWEYRKAIAVINELRQQLAAAQAQIQQYRDEIKEISDVAFDTLKRPTVTYYQGLKNIMERACASAIPADTSALDAIVQKAGDVMRERMMASGFSQPHEEYFGDTIQLTIRALPGVKLEDLQK